MQCHRSRVLDRTVTPRPLAADVAESRKLGRVTGPLTGSNAARRPGAATSTLLRHSSPMSVLSTGYRGNADWRDMSEFAVHFTKPSLTASEYEVIMKIL